MRRDIASVHVSVDLIDRSVEIPWAFLLNLSDGAVFAFVYIFVDILDRTYSGRDLHIDVAVVLSREIWIVWYDMLVAEGSERAVHVLFYLALWHTTSAICGVTVVRQLCLLLERPRVPLVAQVLAGLVARTL